MGLHRPQISEVTRYREWMTANRPVDDAEVTFLKHENDLFVLPRRRFETSTVTASAASVPLMMLLPLIAFVMLPSFLGRIITIVVMATSQWMVGSLMDIRHVLTVREWIACTGM